MCSALRVAGRAIAVMPLASAAIAISSTLSSVSVPCSQSSSTQSKPNAPSISTICGEGIMTDTPNTGSPARSFSFMRFVFISFSVAREGARRRVDRRSSMLAGAKRRRPAPSAGKKPRSRA